MVPTTDFDRTCPSCGITGNGKFCSQCGGGYLVKRITLPALLHDVFHFFTHLDKGFGFTLKQLILVPGTMQRNYIQGNRINYQKPFSMFFICATATTLIRYWILLALNKYYSAANLDEANFFHEYLVLMQIALFPLYTLFAWLLFYKSKYNYAEVGVLMLYTTSFFFVMSALIFALKFIWPDMDTAYVELPAIIVYNSFTFINFFRDSTKWIVFVKSFVMIVVIFFLIQFTETLLQHYVYHN